MCMKNLEICHSPRSTHPTFEFYETQCTYVITRLNNKCLLTTYLFGESSSSQSLSRFENKKIGYTIF